MKTYNRLSLKEREKMLELKAEGHSIRTVSYYLNRSPSTISRELKRNRTPSPLGPAYRPSKAHFQARMRMKQCHRKQSPFDKDPVLQAYVEKRLKNRWSPELIAGRLKREKRRSLISHESIYRWVYTEARHLIPCLVRCHPKRGKRHSKSWIKRFKKQRVSIHKRPEEVNRRLVAGHWESDLVWGDGRAALHVIVERKTRFTRLTRLPDKTARQNYLALSKILAQLPPQLRQSITYDNGVENFLFDWIKRFYKTKAYFCDPYSAWQKGTVENTNGLIRRFLPKATDFDTIPTEDIKRVQDWLNNRPRKCLKFETPAEAFQAIVALAT